MRQRDYQVKSSSQVQLCSCHFVTSCPVFVENFIFSDRTAETFYPPPQKALEAYSSCLDWISDTNLPIRRDVLEGMARCCTKLGQRDRALDLVHLLVKEPSFQMMKSVWFCLVPSD